MIEIPSTDAAAASLGTTTSACLVLREPAA
jgi:hypothetical protein